MTDDAPRPLWQRDEERFASRRASYLARTVDIAERKGEALAWSELGYSHSGIAERVEKTEGTVEGYLDELEVRFGPDAVQARRPDEITIDADLARVTRELLLDFPPETGDRWGELAAKHPEYAPDWAEDLANGGGGA